MTGPHRAAPRGRVLRAECGHWAAGVVHVAHFRAPGGAVVARRAVEHLGHRDTWAEALALACWALWWRGHDLAALEWVASGWIDYHERERRQP